MKSLHLNLTVTKKTVLLCIMMLFAAFSAKAQLVYQDNALTFNGPSYGSYTDVTWHGLSYVWMSGKGAANNAGTALKITLNFGEGPWIGSNTDRITFRDVDKPNITGYLDIYAKNYYTLVDITATTNIAPVGSALKAVLALRPVTYQLQNQTQATQFKTTSSLSATSREIGFIPQEIEQVLPDVISIDESGNQLINYQALIPVLTAAIQDLNARIEVLEQQLNEKQSNLK